MALLFAGLTLVFSLSDLSTAGNLGTNSDLAETMQFSLVKGDEDMKFGPVHIPGNSWVKGISDILLWNYPVFAGEWGYFRTFLLYPLSFITTVMLITTLSSLGLNFIRSIRGLIPFIGG